MQIAPQTSNCFSGRVVLMAGHEMVHMQDLGRSTPLQQSPVKRWGVSAVYGCKCAIVVQLRGYGMSADAHHITQPPPDGAGAALAMERALENAGALPEQVTYVNAHGTGTPLGDVAELTAIQKVFGSAGPPQEHDEKHRVSLFFWPSEIM